jgi:class 3 adenylate cyclase
MLTVLNMEWASKEASFQTHQDRFYLAIAQLKLCDTSTKQEKYKRIKSAKYQLKRLTAMAKYAPTTYANKAYLIKAELMRVTGKFHNAVKFYNLSIKEAIESHAPHELALANELAADFFIQIDNKKFAKIYINDAYKAYENWGSKHKQHQLIELYPDLITLPPKKKERSTTVTEPTTIKNISEAFDLKSILKSVQEFSEETELAPLMKALLSIIATNTGATNCMLLLVEADNLKIWGRYQENNITVLESIELTNDIVPISIINYVRRTQEPLLFDKAIENENCRNDPYIKANKSLSVMAVPLIYHGKFFGVCYCENNSAPSVFQSKRLEFIKLISVNIASAIENARHFEKIERFSKASLRFVPENILNLLGKKDIEEVQTGDNTIVEMGTMFADIRGSTTLIEKLGSKKTAFLLNHYMQSIMPLVSEQDGFISQFVGDGIFSLFPKTADHAIKAAVNILNSMPKFNQYLMSKDLLPIEIGISICYGKVMLIILGNNERMDPSMVSDVINSASRIESLNKVYGTKLLINDTLKNQIQDSSQFLIRFIDRVKLIGKTEITGIYEVFAEDDTEENRKIHDLIRCYETALGSYTKRDFETALEGFNSCLELVPNDRPSMVIKQRCEQYLIKEPEKDWDGSFVMDRK